MPMNYFTKRAFALISAIAVLLMLGGCPSTAVLQQEMNSQRAAEFSKIKQSEANAEIERHKTARAFTSPEAQLAYTISEGIAAALRAAGGGKASELPPMPVIEGWDDKLLRGLSILAPVAANVAGNVMQYKLGQVQAQAGKEIALGDQRARVDTINAVTTGMGNLATSGFAAATALGTRPTTVVNGNGNAVNGSSVATTTTSTNNCPGASGGNGAPSGSTGNTGAGGSGTATTGTGTGAPSGTAGTTGSGGNGTAGAVNCNAGK